MALQLFTTNTLANKSSGFNALRAIATAGFHTTSASCQAAPVEWTVNSIRTGVIARKKGMTSVWSEFGIRMPVTVLQLEDNIITHVRTEEKHGYTAVQVGCTPKKEKNAAKPLIEHFKKLGVELRQKLFEFRVTKDAILPIGTELTATHFVEGQFVDVTAPFEKLTRNYNLGLPASHGVSLTHRSGGSTGQRKWPSKVFKGKKMAGRLGGQNVTVQSLKVVKVDPELNLVFVKGSVPGFDDQFIKIKDAVKLRGEKLFPKEAMPPPFPTAIKQ
ncbi:unnamed protein product [Rhizopus stolonifer]